MRKRALEQSRYFVDQQLGDPHVTVVDLQGRLAMGDTSITKRLYQEKVLKPVFGVSDYWYRYEFAKSRGQIHWHQLSWRDDRQPHQLLHEAREDGCDEDELMQ